MFWALSAVSTASETPAAFAAEFTASSSLWDQGSAVGDLDGDGRPDLAIVRQKGRSAGGFRYQVEINLTTRTSPTCFSVSASEGGLNIIPRDVDGDGDLDLVITSAWSLSPVGLWINDGHGGFTQGDPSAYPQSIWTESSGISSNSPQQAVQATVPMSYGSGLDSFRESHFRCELPCARLRLSPIAANPQLVAISRPQTRAPPSFLLFQPR
jgi:hypothetical protein